MMNLEDVSGRERSDTWFMCEVYKEDLDKYSQEFSFNKFVENLRGFERVRGVIVSPLHDKDVHEDTGELKKAHWHIVLYCKKNTTCSMLARSNATTENCLYNCPCHNHFKIVDKPQSMVRYLAHLDEEKKYKYSPYDILFFDEVQKYKRWLFDSYYDANMFTADFWGHVVTIRNKREFWLSLGGCSPEFQKFVYSHGYVVNTMLQAYFEKEKTEEN